MPHDILVTEPPAKSPEPPACPSCGGQMRLCRVTPAFAKLPELLSFRCVDCGDVVTEPEE